MKPALSIGLTVQGENSLQIKVGQDRYDSYIVSNYPELTDGVPVAFIQVGRQVQPIGIGYYHTGSASD